MPNPSSPVYFPAIQRPTCTPSLKLLNEGGGKVAVP